MPDVVVAAHILRKHTGSRNPVSRRTGQQITRSKEEAIAELQEYLGALSGLEGQELVDAFMKIASESSDCSSFRNGGNLGEFGPGMMQKPFEDASFGLEVGGMTPDIVDTDSGVHLVLRLA
mmetsp:Transcript_37240/g.116416  ORF Transcript_37240/g.116416 Transcript_37240/m.116416 type:complete len:121 (-) Transcript_37240:808-1170(-)